ncbi:reverse transcriptase domain-containing protein, partial [Tanacetum coccineum]
HENALWSKKRRGNIPKVGQHHLRRENREELEAYMDDMVIKSKTELEMIKDVEETLMTLKKSKSGKNKGCNEHGLTKQPETNATAKCSQEGGRAYGLPISGNKAVSAVLLVERDGRQIPIHYASRTLQGAEINYPTMEKLALALVHAARRLRRHNDRGQHYTGEDKRAGRYLSRRRKYGRARSHTNQST